MSEFKVAAYEGQDGLVHAVSFHWSWPDHDIREWAAWHSVVRAKCRETTVRHVDAPVNCLTCLGMGDRR
jgi:hypothetical protein